MIDSGAGAEARQFGAARPWAASFPFILPRKIPLVIRRFPAAPRRKTGGKSWCSWHIPCSYLRLSIEMIEMTGIDPAQHREPVTGSLRIFCFRSMTGASLSRAR
jgi:hypothetical protein